jgi:3-methylfumaryl-CoA hydratase
MTTSLHEYVDGWSPQETTQHDLLDEQRARWLADILDAPELPVRGELPPTWQWGYFTGWPPHAALNADGHPSDGPFQPPIPERRRMWAGGSLSVHRPLLLDAEVERRGSLLSAVPKSGRSGEMVLVGVQYDYLQDGRLCHREVQNHVYRSGAGAPAPQRRPERPRVPVETDAPWRHDIVTDPIRLFRLSALTGNSHRIHYDRPYATEVEGYPDLVVHGPLLAQQLAILGSRRDPARSLEQFDYRVLQPVFVGDAVSATGRPDGTGARLEVLSEGQRVHVSATARYRLGV